MHGHDIDARLWGEDESRWAAYLGPLAGSAFGFLLCLIFVPLANLLTLSVAVLLWSDIALLCWLAFKTSRCREWREYHEALAANPVLWPWPRMPGDVA